MCSGCWFELFYLEVNRRGEIADGTDLASFSLSVWELHVEYVRMSRRNI